MNEQVGIQMRVPSELRELLHQKAKRNGKSLNQFCIEVLADEVGYEWSEDDL